MGVFCIIVFCALLQGLSYGSPVTPIVYDTIVVGLGASGTAAATTLAAAGKKVLALEAQNRIGGRVYTVPFGNSIVELGAEWIHGNESSSTYELAIKNNVTILDQNMNFKVFFSDGSSENQDLIAELIDYAMQQVDNPPEDPEPIGQYVTRKVHDHIRTNYPSIQNDTDLIENFLEFMDTFATTYDSSNSWNDVTTHSQYRDLKGSNTFSWHKYGYKTLFEILLNTYNNGPGYPNLDIKLNTEVTMIQWPQDPQENVVVTTKDGSTYTAKTVIVTLSVGVLKERAKSLFSPPLPEDKLRSIEAISMGVCSKTILRFTTPWWPADSFNGFIWKNADREKVSEEDRWLLKVEVAGTPMSSNESLTLWACGDTAKKIETMPEDVLISKSMGLIRRFMGVNRTIPEPVEMLRSAWFSNPFTRGSYTFDNVNTPQYPTARADLARPLADAEGKPRLLFAGEATDSQHFATVHGAVDTGKREAERLLAASK